MYKGPKLLFGHASQAYWYSINYLRGTDTTVYIAPDYLCLVVFVYSL